MFWRGGQLKFVPVWWLPRPGTCREGRGCPVQSVNSPIKGGKGDTADHRKSLCKAFDEYLHHGALDLCSVRHSPSGLPSAARFQGSIDEGVSFDEPVAPPRCRTGRFCQQENDDVAREWFADDVKGVSRLRTATGPIWLRAGNEVRVVLFFDSPFRISQADSCFSRYAEL